MKALKQGWLCFFALLVVLAGCGTERAPQGSIGNPSDDSLVSPKNAGRTFSIKKKHKNLPLDVNNDSYMMGYWTGLEYGSTYTHMGTYRPASTNADFVSSRFLNTNADDTSYDGDGTATINFTLNSAGHSDDIASAGINVIKTGAVCGDEESTVMAGATKQTGGQREMAFARLRQTGALDTSFGASNNGKVTVNFGTGHDTAEDIIELPDGSYIYVGRTGGTGGTTGATADSNYDFAIGSLTEFGAENTAFGGGDGRLTLNVFGKEDALRAATYQVTSEAGQPTSFRYLAVGFARYSTASNGYLPIVAAINDAGTGFDTSWGAVNTDYNNPPGTRVFPEWIGTCPTTPYSPSENCSNLRRIRTYGDRIYVAGEASVGPSGRFVTVIAALTSDGSSLDTNWGEDGTGRWTWTGTDGAQGRTATHGLVIQANGKIVVSGWTETTQGDVDSRDFFMMRLNDTTCTDPYQCLDNADDGFDQDDSSPDGILVEGKFFCSTDNSNNCSYERGDYGFSVAQNGNDFLVSGMTDTTSTGVRSFDTAWMRTHHDYARDGRQSWDNKLAAASMEGNSNICLSAPTQPNCIVDCTSFSGVCINVDSPFGAAGGGAGAGALPPPPSRRRARASSRPMTAVYGSDTKENAGGLTQTIGAGYVSTMFGGVDFAIGYNVEESENQTNFTVDFGTTEKARAAKFVNNSTSKVFAVGEVDGDMAFAYADLSTGNLLADFDTDGKKTVSIGSNDVAKAFVQADLSYVISGAGAGDTAVVVMSSAGTLTGSFSGDGIATTDWGNSDEAYNAVAVQANGKIVAAGYTKDSGSLVYTGIIARYNADGTLDSTFDSDGKISVSDCDDDANEGVIFNAIGVQSGRNGKIVVAGECIQETSGGLSYAYARRYNTDGSLDTGFATSGVFKLNAHKKEGDYVNRIHALTILGSGKIMLAGSSADEGSTGCLRDQLLLVALKSNGKLAKSFDKKGYFVKGHSNYQDALLAVRFVTGNSWVAGGRSQGLSETVKVLSWRFNHNGGDE